MQIGSARTFIVVLAVLSGGCAAPRTVDTAGPNWFSSTALNSAAHAGASPINPVPLIFASDIGDKFHGKAASVCAYAVSGSGQSPLWCQTKDSITQPSGMAVDRAGNLYVADSSAILEYDAPVPSKPPGPPSFTYTDALAPYGSQAPNSVTVCGDYLYAANLTNNSGSTQYSSFTVWQLGDATPLGIFTQTSYAETLGVGIACDPHDSVDFAWQVMPSGATHPLAKNRSAAIYSGVDAWTQAASGNLPSFIGNLLATNAHDAGVAVNDDGIIARLNPAYSKGHESGGAVEFYKAGKSHPFRACGPPGIPITGPIALTYVKGDRELWVADARNLALYEIDVRTCTVLDAITAGNGGTFTELAGVAVRPNPN